MKETNVANEKSVENAAAEQQQVINKKTLRLKKILKWIMWILVLFGVGASVAHVTKKIKNRPTDNGTVKDDTPATQPEVVKEEPRQQENNNQPNGWKDRNRHGQQNGGNNKKW